MRVLFFSNAMPAFFSTAVPGTAYVTGGWIDGAIESLTVEKDLTLLCAFPISPGSDTEGSCKGVRYKGIPMGSAFSGEADLSALPACRALISAFAPDIIQIWGTESAAPLPLLTAAKEAGLVCRTAVHLQGLCGAIADTYEAGLPPFVQKAQTFRDLLRKDSILNQKQAYRKRAKAEEAILLACGHAFGRTAFDRSEAKRINPGICYHRIEETLRPIFYEAPIRESRIPHRIFISQGNYPLKGLHFVPEALAILTERYPDVTLHIAGGDPTRSREGIRGRFSVSAYGVYLKRLIRKYDLADRITFTGTLDPEEMLREYREANVFLSASVLENSPNSVAEAMLLEVPVVATRVGGTEDILPETCGHLIPPMDSTAIAEAVADIFDDPGKAADLAEKARAHALSTHDPETNRQALLDAYLDILALPAEKSSVRG